MALPFYNIMGPLMPSLADAGIYDPESGLSYIGPEARIPGGGDPDKTVVPTGLSSKAAAQANQLLEGTGLSVKPNTDRNIFTDDKGNIVERITYVSGRVEDKIIQAAPPEDEDDGTITYTAPDGTTFTDQQAYVNYLALLDRRNKATADAASDATLAAANTARNQKNAREFLLGTLRQYFSSEMDKGFITDLEKIIDDYVKQDYDVETISVLLPQTEPYKKRFAGNEKLISSGMAPLSPAEYLQAESQYNEILRRFNLGDLSTRDTFNTLIGGQVSAAELTDRVVNVYDRIRNADPALRAELDRVEALGGGLTDADFAKALLTGAEGANELKRKIATAEISAEARTRGLSVARAEDLQRQGITRQQASAGFEQIRLTQPTMEKLSDIYRRDLTPTTAEGRAARTEEFQTELEREQFGGLASERRRRLAEQEQTAFMGQAGTASGISLGRRRRGQF